MATEEKKDVQEAPVPPEDPEACLADLYQNDVLHDIQIVNQSTHSSSKVHMAIVASGSKYFLEVFKHFKAQDKLKTVEFNEQRIDIPLPVQTGHMTQPVSSDENVNRILKYIYNNQNFDVIRAEITEANISQLYAQAHVLRCTNLLKELEAILINELLNPDNAMSFYLDSIIFDNQQIARACEMIIQQYFAEILEKSQKDMLDLPYRYLISLCKADALNIKQEKDLLAFFEMYLKHRESCPMLPEEDPELQTWHLLTDEEKEKRNKDKEEKKKEEADKLAQAEADEKAAYDAKDDIGKWNADWAKKVKTQNQHCLDRTKISRLSKDSKKELFKTVRFSYIKHEDLIELTQYPALELAKDYIMEGLSFRLNNFENAIKKELNINCEPRVNYTQNADNQPVATFGQAQDPHGGAPAFGAPTFNQQATPGVTPGFTSTGNPIADKLRGMMQAGQAKKQGQSPHRRLTSWDNKVATIQANQPTGAIGSKNHPNQYLRKSNYDNFYERELAEEREKHQAMEQKLIMNQIGMNLKQQMQQHGGNKSKTIQLPAGIDLTKLTPSELNALQHGYTPQQQNVQLQNQNMAKTVGAPSMTLKQPAGPVPPQKANMALTINHNNEFGQRPYEFVFQQAFDEEGALYFLGSFGKRRLYQNPHTLGQVQAFCSSIGAGRAEDIVGRTPTNCRTGNEPFSYFGVDLGEGRQLLPTCYSIRNRNNTATHTMLNWHFEGSNDKVNWTTLDRRLYRTGDPAADAASEEERNMLCVKGAATSWSLDTDIYREIGFDGFRYFRIIQVGVNSSGSNNLALSGLELYGRVISGRWP